MDGTTEPDSQGKFYAFVYRTLKERWKLEKKVTFGKRHKAKERAFKWFEARKEKLEPKIAGLPLTDSRRASAS